MIRHNFRCNKGHITEQWCNWNDESKPCTECKQPARMVFLPRRQDAQNFAPVVIFRGPKGKVRFPGRSNAPTPKGYERVELRTSHEVHKFEREMNQREISRYHDRQEREECCYEPFHKRMREQLRGEMTRFSPLGRDFAETAMRENNNRPRRRFDPGFHVEAFHYNMGKRNGR